MAAVARSYDYVPTAQAEVLADAKANAFVGSCYENDLIHC